MNLFRKKNIAELIRGTEGNSLKKTLGAMDLVLLGIGCIIGTGIFVLTGVAAAKYAGPGIMLSFVLSGLACAFAALAYAELASMVPVTGSAYTFAYVAIGEVVAFAVGWALICEYTIGSAAIAAGWSGYMVGLLKSAGIALPTAWTAVPADGGILNVPSVVIIAFLTYLLILGTRESASLNKILVFIKLGCIGFFLLVATPHINPVNWQPFLPYGLGGVAAGAAIVFFAYIGFDTVSTAVEECKNPNRDIPIGIVGSLVVATILYIAVAAVLTGVVPYSTLNNSEPVAFALRAIGMNFGSALVALGAICGITTVLLVFMYGQTRIFLAMARDGMIPQSLVKIHPKYGTPHIITMIAGCVVATLSGLLPINIIAELCNMGTLFAFVIVSIGVWVLRSTQPDLPRPFRCPAVKVIVPFAVLLCSYLITNLPVETLAFFGCWCVIGMVVYFTYSRKNSAMVSKNTNISQKG
ncbi:amino acid permease [Sporomusa acidovorans]|uniref:Amino acid permease YhdG n=1 Tax=Sporomusa acidovorans (strain ATCC 49682 / DSM 3132 / Mol) TaxID=1123286 RepID=A0ABZ3IYN7_SPOA4|nr:amino acid permease [Sporomusa acidovorans]OZC22163.1 putative amino acid permease YhdG [Sporomusa acidovorans DSM 3132]SDE82359.1 amino acid/polyamine/organocation transporter, APC superfamily [Sporomusa acidovorans]